MQFIVVVKKKKNDCIGDRISLFHHKYDLETLRLESKIIKTKQFNVKVQSRFHLFRLVKHK